MKMKRPTKQEKQLNAVKLQRLEDAKQRLMVAVLKKQESLEALEAEEKAQDDYCDLYAIELQAKNKAVVEGKVALDKKVKVATEKYERAAREHEASDHAVRHAMHGLERTTCCGCCFI